MDVWTHKLDEVWAEVRALCEVEHLHLDCVVGVAELITGGRRGIGFLYGSVTF